MLVPTIIEARDLSDSWFQCVRAVINEQGTHKYAVGKGGSFENQWRIELDFAVVKILQPGNRPLSPFVPEGVVPPCTDAYIEEYLPYLLTGDKKVNEEYTYGEFLELQIPRVIELFRLSGEGTNQACMTVGNGESIFLGSPPCLKIIDCRLLNGCLHFIVYFRSWDLWGGYPANLGAIQLLKEHIADELGVVDGELIALSKGLHLYDHCWDLARTVVGG